MNDDVKRHVRESQELVAKIGALLNGRSSQVAGLVLADLTATWLAGHFVRDGSFQCDDVTALVEGKKDVQATHVMRVGLLALQTQYIVKLIPENEREIIERYKCQNFSSST